MKKATHNGTCQVCARVQADTPNGLAKHGYTTQWGYFNGTCRGSDNAPIEQSTTILDRTVIKLTKLAAELHAVTAETCEGFSVTFSGEARDGYGRRSKEVASFGSESDWDEFRKTEAGVRAGYSNATGHYARTNDYHSWSSHIEREVVRLHRDADQMLSHCEALEGLKVSRYGQPLYPRNAVNPDRCLGSKCFPGGERSHRVYQSCAVCGRAYKVNQYGEIPAHKKPKEESKTK